MVSLQRRGVLPPRNPSPQTLRRLPHVSRSTQQAPPQANSLSLILLSAAQQGTVDVVRVWLW